MEDKHPAVSEAMREAVARDTRWPILKAMAANYHDGHRWDHLDADACAKGADEIRGLRAENARLTGERDAAREDCAKFFAASMRAGDSNALYLARTEAAEAETARLRADADRFRALMRCGRIKPQGSCGVDPKTGARTYFDQPGSVHFGAEFWVAPEDEPSNLTIWGRHCLRALADDILAFEARAALTSQEQADV